MNETEPKSEHRVPPPPQKRAARRHRPAPTAADSQLVRITSRGDGRDYEVENCGRATRKWRVTRFSLVPRGWCPAVIATSGSSRSPVQSNARWTYAGVGPHWRNRLVIDCVSWGNADQFEADGRPRRGCRSATLISLTHIRAPAVGLGCNAWRIFGQVGTGVILALFCWHMTDSCFHVTAVLPGTALLDGSLSLKRTSIY